MAVKVAGNDPLNTTEEEDRRQIEVNENRVAWWLNTDDRRERTRQYKKGSRDGEIPCAAEIEQESIESICFHKGSTVVERICVYVACNGTATGHIEREMSATEELSVQGLRALKIAIAITLIQFQYLGGAGGIQQRNAA